MFSAWGNHSSGDWSVYLTTQVLAVEGQRFSSSQHLRIGLGRNWPSSSQIEAASLLLGRCNAMLTMIVCS